MRITANSRTLEVTSLYFGGAGLNQLIVIDKVKIYYDDIQITNSFVNPIEINGPNKIVVPINDE
jgi:hypothetical protein